jgi:antirestriction protein ArdC
MNKSEIYTRITDKLLAKLDEGVIPWRRSWSIGVPQNLISKRPYNGINFLSLLAEDYPSPYYLTFLQAKERGATINKGAAGSLIVFGRFSR